MGAGECGRGGLVALGGAKAKGAWGLRGQILLSLKIAFASWESLMSLLSPRDQTRWVNVWEEEGSV